MRKWTVVVALIGAVVLAAAVHALEVNSLRPVKVILPATEDSLKFVVHASNPSGLPSGIMAFNGAGDEFHANMWENIDGVWQFGETFGVPGSFMLPRPVPERRGDSLYCIVKLYCATDTLAAFGTDR